MKQLHVEQVENTLRTLCSRLGDEYAGYHLMQAGTLGGEPCPNLVFHGKKRIYSALLGTSQTVVNEFETGKKLAVYRDITKDSLLRETPNSRTLSRRQQERIETVLYDADADPLELLKQIEDSKELHLLAANWNWDNLCTPTLLRSIIRSPLCDRGTALMIYWRTDGVFCRYASRSEVPEWEVEIYDLATEIEQMMVQGAFGHQKIGFDPTDETQLGGNYRLLLHSARRPVPSIMLEAAAGEPLVETF